FTTLPSDLKQFVTFNKMRLKEADIRSSQPFILTVILNIIKQEYSNEIERFNKITFKKFSNRLYKRLSSIINIYNGEEYNIDIRSICNDITIILQETLEPFDFTEIDTFNSLIRNGDIYIYVGDKLLESEAIWFENDKVVTKLFDKERRIKRKFEFEDLRVCAKKITIKALYASSKKTGVKALNDFRILFPEVAKLLDVIKQGEKAQLPILMQRIESKCVLDHCASRIAKKHPKMLLVARHDSLSTTEDNFDLLKSEFQVLLNGYFEIDVGLG